MKAAEIDLDVVYHLDQAKRVRLVEDTPRFQQAAAWVAQRFQLARLTASVSIVDDPTIHEINREHLNHDWPTDVISFVFEETEEAGERCVDGEIIASADTAERLALQAGWRSQDELLLYCIHGLLHLAGLDDIEDDEKLEMRAAEQACLVALGVPGAEQHLSRWENVSY
jgi:probable rRNA maturation factor